MQNNSYLDTNKILKQLTTSIIKSSHMQLLQQPNEHIQTWPITT